jgi:hypothetical protein
VVALLDGREKRVEVDVNDGEPTVGHGRMMARTGARGEWLRGAVTRTRPDGG